MPRHRHQLFTSSPSELQRDLSMRIEYFVMAMFRPILRCLSGPEWTAVERVRQAFHRRFVRTYLDGANDIDLPARFEAAKASLLKINLLTFHPDELLGGFDVG